MVNPGLARPNQIWVYDFVPPPADMPADSSISGNISAPSTPPTAEQIETGRRFGALIAQDLVVASQNLIRCDGRTEVCY